MNVTKFGTVTLWVKRGDGETVHNCCKPVNPVTVLSNPLKFNPRRATQ